MSWFWMNIPLMVVFFAAWTGIPLYLVLRHPDTGPGVAEAELAVTILADEGAAAIEADLAGVS